MRRRRRARKPKILKTKIKVAVLLREKHEPAHYYRHKGGFYWKASYLVDGVNINIFWQNYIRRLAVDYIEVRHSNGCMFTPKEIRELYKKLTA